MSKVTFETEMFFEEMKKFAEYVCKEGNELDMAELIAILHASRQATAQLADNVAMAKQIEAACTAAAGGATEEEEDDDEADIESMFAVAVPKRGAKKKAKK